MADWHARQRRRGDRYDAAGLRAATERESETRSAIPVGALHAHQRRPGRADQGTGCDSHAVFNLCLLPWRKDAELRRGAVESHVRAAKFPGCGNSRDAGFGLSSGRIYSDNGAAIGSDSDGHEGEVLGAETENTGGKDNTPGAD